jgi:hypothetical protein
VTRRRLAIAACLLWLLGVEVLPAVHQATHASLAPHRHDAGGMIVTVTFGEPTHRHADGTIHSHSDAPPTKRRHRDDRSRVRDDLGHDAAGLAHHATALSAAAPPLTRPLPIDRRPWLVQPRTARVLVSATVPAAAARGPPGWSS